jgi:MFS transporter, DHA3 family, tetracycline resistance protein
MILSLIAVDVIKRHLERTGKLEKVWLLLIINLLMVITLFLFAIANEFFIASSLYIVFYTVRRINQPIYRAWLNEYIETKVRATVLSFYGQLDSLGQIIGGPIIGYITLRTSISFGIMISSFILSPVLILYLFFIIKVKKDDTMV